MTEDEFRLAVRKRINDLLDEWWELDPEIVKDLPLTQRAIPQIGAVAMEWILDALDNECLKELVKSRQDF